MPLLVRILKAKMPLMFPQKTNSFRVMIDHTKILARTKDFSKKMKANREHLGSVIRRVATMANAKTRLVVFNFQGKTLQLSARNPDLGGDSEESLPVEFQGEAVEVGINAAYLLEELRLAHSEEVRFKFNNPLGAVVVEPVAEKADYFFIVMPLRILKEPG